MDDRIKTNAISDATTPDATRESAREDEISRIPSSDQRRSDGVTFWQDKYARLFADLENTKKRLIWTSAKEVELKKETLLRDILPVADGLDLAILHISRDMDSRNFLQGIEMIRNILDKFFSKYEVKVIDAWGKPFDPSIHEAIGMMPHPEFPPKTVVKVQQKGYLYRDKLLRPVLVLVTPS